MWRCLPNGVAELEARRVRCDSPFVTVATATYRVVYDASDLWFPAWPIAVVGLAVALAGVALGAYLRRRGHVSAVASMIVTSAIIFGVSWSLLVGGGLFAQHGQLRRALADRSYMVVEGDVHDSPPDRGSGDEGSWVVEVGQTAHWYRYDRSLLGVGYRRRGPGDGGLRNGMRVRLADVGGRIARVEVAE